MTLIAVIGFSQILETLFLETLSPQGYQIKFYSIQAVQVDLKALISFQAILVYASDAGLALIQQLTQHPQLQQIPLALSGMRVSHQKGFWEVNPELSRTWVEAFCQNYRYLTIPFLAEDLINLIENLVANR